MPTTNDEPGKELSLEFVARDMPTLLEDAEKRLVAAKEYVDNFPAIVDEETKDNAKALVAQMKDRLNTVNSTRMPFTRKLNEIIKKFTTNEGGWEDLITKMEKKINKWAADERQKTLAAQAKIDADVAAAKAKIELEGRIREHFRQRIDAMLDQVRAGTGKLVDEVTQENAEVTKKRLAGDPQWKPEQMEPYYYEQPKWITDLKHFKEIGAAELEENKKVYLEKSKRIMTDALNIVDVALTNKAEALKMQEAAKDQAKKEAEQRTDEAQAKIDAEKAFAGMDAEKPEGPAVRVKMKIESVNSKAGWAEVIKFWLEFNQEDIADYPKRTLQQMVNFAQAKCNRDGTMITHEDVVWIEDVKAK